MCNFKAKLREACATTIYNNTIALESLSLSHQGRVDESNLNSKLDTAINSHVGYLDQQSYLFLIMIGVYDLGMS